MKSAPRQRKAANKGRYVTGFHFVCDADKGVTLNPDGTFWSGIWVVAEVHAERAPRGVSPLSATEQNWSTVATMRACDVHR
jgi:hypothetical protein